MNKWLILAVVVGGVDAPRDPDGEVAGFHAVCSLSEPRKAASAPSKRWITAFYGLAQENVRWCE